MATDQGRASPIRDQRDKILIILSSSDAVSATQPLGGVSATSFIETYVHLSSASFSIVMATPNGSPPSFTCEDDKTQQWMKSRANMWQNIASIATIRESDFAAVIIPHAIGGLKDLSSPDSSCAKFMTSFLKLGRPICAIGFGVSALLGTTKEKKDRNTIFGLSSRCVTAPSNAEISRFDYFKFLCDGQIEDAIRERGANYSCSEVDTTHVVVDGSLVTAQNPQSTALAIQNVIWLWKAAQQSFR